MIRMSLENLETSKLETMDSPGTYLRDAIGKPEATVKISSHHSVATEVQLTVRGRAHRQV